MRALTSEDLARLAGLSSRSETLQAALAYLRTLDAACGYDPSWLANRGCFLIDIGDGLNSPDLVTEGIATFRALPAHLADARLAYNLATGYNTMFTIERRGEQFEHDPDDQNLACAKLWFRRCLALDMTAHDRAKALVNYGNALSAFGRSVEAVEQYLAALHCQPDFGMALGQLAIELRPYVAISWDCNYLNQAKQLLEAALATDDIDEDGMPGCRQFLQQQAIDLASVAAGHEDCLEAQAGDDATVPLSGYARFCRDRNLMLDFSLGLSAVQSSARDHIYFRSFLLQGDADESRLRRLVYIVNDIKESFVTARWLFYQACLLSDQIDDVEEMTIYVDNSEDALHGVHSGSLKQAFQSAYNVLDKVALCLWWYFGLASPKEHGVDFKSVWRATKTATLRPDLRRTRNFGVFALYDLHKDLAGGDFSDLARLRNLMTHRYVVPHNGVLLSDVAEERGQHIHYAELIDACLQLLRLVRAAIIYLMAAINQAEAERVASAVRDGAPTPPVLCDLYQHKQIRHSGL